MEETTTGGMEEMIMVEEIITGGTEAADSQTPSETQQNVQSPPEPACRMI